MATQVSPGVLVQEVDKTLAVPQIQPPVGAIAGHFTWGPVEQVVTVTSEDELVSQFGKPGANSADYFFTAANFLSYSNALRVVRVVNSAASKAATLEPNPTAISGAVLTLGASNTSANVAGVNAEAVFVAGQTLFVGNTGTANVELTIASVTNSSAVVFRSAPAGAIVNASAYAFGLYVKNEEHYNETFADGSASVGSWGAKWVGALGNSLRVEVCASANAFSQSSVDGTTVNVASTSVTVSGNVAAYVQVGDVITASGSPNELRAITAIANNTTFTINAAFSTATFNTSSWTRKWKYASLFGGAPGTSSYASARGGSQDELHVVVVDEDGLVTGAANTVLEKFAFVSKASDAKNDVGSNIYYKDVLNGQSSYVWWLDHPSTGTNWGSAASGLTFGVSNLILGGSLKGGIDGGSVVNADLFRGYDVFKNETVEMDTVLGASANATLASYVINNIVLARKYVMGFFSPERSDVVNQAGSEVNNILDYRNNLPSTSYAVLDSGWKYQYDKYNDVYRYVPLNGDVAGCLVRTSQQAETWFSPAGFTRGQVKNVVKLAWNPKQVDRDDLYVKGVNPVVTFPGQGTVLFGDKTLLSKPTAFDRINVRRLFIVLEKAIEGAAQQLLFEQNDEFSRNQFVNLVEPYLRQVKGRRGISDFIVVCDETNNPPDAVDRNEFRADVYVKPIRSINFIQLNVVAVRSDVAFNEIITNLQ